MLKKETNANAEWDLVIAPGRAEKNYWRGIKGCYKKNIQELTKLQVNGIAKQYGSNR